MIAIVSLFSGLWRLCTSLWVVVIAYALLLAITLPLGVILHRELPSPSRPVTIEPGAGPVPDYDWLDEVTASRRGLLGTLTVLILFGMLAYHGYRIAINAPDTFSGLLAAGITTWLVVQACVNMMVVTALMPVTGIPLPFISYGGTALTLNLVAVGILLSISRETTQTGSLLDAVFGVGRRDRRARVPRAGRRTGTARRAARA